MSLSKPQSHVLRVVPLSDKDVRGLSLGIANIHRNRHDLSSADVSQSRLYSVDRVVEARWCELLLLRGALNERRLTTWLLRGQA